MRGDEHAAAEGAAVARPRPSSRRSSIGSLAVEDDREPGRAARRSGRGWRRRRRRGCPCTSRASLAIRLASESKPQEATQRKRRPFASPTSIWRSCPSASTATAPAGSVGMPRTRARSLPRPPGMIPSGVRCRRARRRPGRPGRRRSSRPGPRPPRPPRAPRRRRARGSRCGRRGTSTPLARELALDLGQQLQRLPAGRVRVDEQRGGVGRWTIR